MVKKKAQKLFGKLLLNAKISYLEIILMFMVTPCTVNA